MRYFIFIIFLTGFALYSQETHTTNTVDLIRKCINNKDNNNPYTLLDTYQYNSYQNLKIAGNPDAITGTGYKIKELRNTLKKTGVYISEKTSKHFYDYKKGKKELITATYVAGFEKPVYPIYNIIFQSDNLYTENYLIFDQAYANPLRKDALKLYNYEHVGDTIIEQRSIQIISFTATSPDTNSLNGKLYIDTNTYGIARAEFNAQGNLDIKASHHYTYNRLHDLWMCTYSDLYIKKKNDIKELEFLGRRIEVGKQKKTKFKDQGLYLILKNHYSDFKTNQKVNYGTTGVALEIEPSAINTPRGYWLTYRDKESLTTTELARFMKLDSLVKAKKVNRQLEIGEKFKIGYFPVGFFDIDLKYLIKFNEYEAFRTGFGGKTNNKLAQNWNIGGYAAYGTNDQQWKYNINLAYRINKISNTWINVYKTDDISEFASAPFLTDARVYSLFEPRLINIPSFYTYKEIGTSIQQRLFPSMISEVSLSRKRISQTTNYQFNVDNRNFDSYVLSEVRLATRWSPKSSFMKTPEEYQEIYKGYPILSAQIDKGIKGIADSDFNYWKFAAKASYSFTRLNNSSTSLLIEGHYATGDLPLTHLFHAYPNSPTKDEILQRFSVAGRNSFETMYFNEFFSDRLVTAQLRHELPSWYIFSWLQPQLVFTSRYAIGDISNISRHRNINFNTLDRGYTESGLEINKLLFGFGLSATYRYGAYHLPKFSNNIALKFTFFMEI